MEYEGSLSIYLAVTAMLATLITLLVAGLIALYQIVDKQIPQRSLGDLIRISVQVLFLGFVATLLCIATVAAWALGTEHDIFPQHNFRLNAVIGQPAMVLWLMIGTLASYACFIIILIESRALFDNAIYIKKSAAKIKKQLLDDYLFAQYSAPPFKFNTLFIKFASGPDDNEPDDEAEKIAEAEAKHEADKENYDKRMSRLSNATNPLGDMMQAATKNANKGNDEVSELIFPLFSEKLSEYVTDGGDLTYFDEYMKDMTIAIKAAASTTTDVGYKRAYIDVLTSVSRSLIQRKEYPSATKVASLLHQFTRDEPYEAVRIHALNGLVDITDSYNEVAVDISEQREYLEHLGNLGLIVARMAENYYHNLTSLTPVAILEDNHHEIEDFGGIMVNYFVPSHRYHERYEDGFPVTYFDAIDLSAEALAGAMARSDTFKEGVGASKYSYSQILSTLYYIFSEYAEKGIKTEQYDVVHNCLYRLQRGLKFMHEHGLQDETDSIAGQIYHLGVMIAAKDGITGFGAFRKSKSEYLKELSTALNEYVVDMNHFKELKPGMDHSLFDYIHTPGADEFVDQIEWDRDEIDPRLSSPFSRL